MAPPTIPLPPQPVPVQGVEWRVRERRPCGLKTSCQPIAARGDKDVMWPATILDISVSGIGLVLSRRFETGAGLAIEVPGTESRPGDTLLAKVVQTNALAEGGWLLSCEFVSELSDEELNGLLELARAQQDPGEGNRAVIGEETLSRSGQEPLTSVSITRFREVLIPRVHFEGTSNAGRVAHVPVRRLYLSGIWPVRPGTVLKIKVAGQRPAFPDVKIRVNSCDLRDGRWTLNYTFLDKPSTDMMGLFGYTVSLMDF
jgi:hypothetical protein